MKRLVTTATIALATLTSGIAAAGVTHDVSVGPGFSFTPADIVIEVGDTVRWTWVSGFHNVESGVGGTHDEVFRSGEPTSVVGTVFEQTFDQGFLDDNPKPGGIYPYFCIVHVGFGMVGSITVIDCPGDINGDSVVDLADLAQLLASYGMSGGATYEDGDLDFDGDVDLSDLAAILAVYGTGC